MAKVQSTRYRQSRLRAQSSRRLSRTSLTLLPTRRRTMTRLKNCNPIVIQLTQLLVLARVKSVSFSAVRIFVRYRPVSDARLPVTSSVQVKTVKSSQVTQTVCSIKSKVKTYTLSKQRRSVPRA